MHTVKPSTGAGKTNLLKMEECLYRSNLYDILSQSPLSWVMNRIVDTYIGGIAVLSSILGYQLYIQLEFWKKILLFS